MSGAVPPTLTIPPRHEFDGQQHFLDFEPRSEVRELWRRVLLPQISVNREGIVCFSIPSKTLNNARLCNAPNQQHIYNPPFSTISLNTTTNPPITKPHTFVRLIIYHAIHATHPFGYFLATNFLASSNNKSHSPNATGKKKYSAGIGDERIVVASPGM